MPSIKGHQVRWLAGDVLPDQMSGIDGIRTHDFTMPEN